MTDKAAPTKDPSRTALKRHELSRPIQLALEDHLILPGARVLDIGCGRGDDVGRLRRMRVRARGWDPVFSPRTRLTPSPVVVCLYVLNVIEDQEARRQALRRAWELTQSSLIVAVRTVSDSKGLEGQQWKDGLVTSVGTFQKLYEHDDFRAFVESVTGSTAANAAPGIVYLFRSEKDRQSFFAERFLVRRQGAAVRLSKNLIASHRALLENLGTFLQERGRLPHRDEYQDYESLRESFGTVRRAFGVLRRLNQEEDWSAITRQQIRDLLVFLALSRFEGRPRFSDLPASIRHDLKHFFGSYKEASLLADKLLIEAGSITAREDAVGCAKVGKVTPGAFYVHKSALANLEPVLRAFEGCARVISGEIPEANVIKLSRTEHKVSYLSYKDFDRVAHPALSAATVVTLRHLDFKTIDYSQESNPPILHRKELFVTKDYPGRERFQKLTVQEERLGFLSANALIGRRNEWMATLAARGRAVRGHRLVRL